MIPDLRIHGARQAPQRSDGDFVLYWMQTTQRVQHNFALEFAIDHANRLRLPVLVYHGLRHDYPWASDRIHSFVLETVVDLYRDFESRGIQYAFYLERTGDDAQARREAGKASPLVELARRAALVVTDFFPTFIVPRQIRALRAKVDTPVIAVDSCTVVPMKYFDREHASAAGFRPRLMAALPEFLLPFEMGEPKFRTVLEILFEPTRPAAESIPRLLASCDIDHSVPPARAIRGGTAAALRRLHHFVESGLARYADDRGDPNEDATSMLSPYLHFGNISPQEILLKAREAGPTDQFAKFQDELLTWREISYNFVYHNKRHRTVEAIPAWAREELRTGEGDPRPVLFSDKELELAQTGNELWDAAQRSYLVDGWMHNSLRMLWGKAVLQWTANAEEALRVLEHLNNKYSLDGRDPNSYGGILWIFGKFDRPFFRRPIYGTVRYQSLNSAEKKFDVAKYVRRHSAGPRERNLSAHVAGMFGHQGLKVRTDAAD
ncbi:MAG: deoxyribodipyrimidine photo-lyase [Anaerolineae bacterium]|nr:deoxyribodipyrimidine photo-lyase [Gemmatimonadaceae bacterium]